MSDPTKFCSRCKAEYDPQLQHVCRLSHVLEPRLEGEKRSDAERHEATRLSRISGVVGGDLEVPRTKNRGSERDGGHFVRRAGL